MKIVKSNKSEICELYPIKVTLEIDLSEPLDEDKFARRLLHGEIMGIVTDCQIVKYPSRLERVYILRIEADDNG